jgi:2-dehydropantoate 2-reductase
MGRERGLMARRIVMFGAGAVGGYVGAHLGRQGHDVTLVDFWHDHIEAIRARGLEVSGLTAEEHQVVPVRTMHLHEVATLCHRDPIDIAFVSVKSYDTDWITTLLRPYLAPDGFVVSLQNCINEERIAAIVGWSRTVGCIASQISVELFEPGRIRRQAAKGSKDHVVFRVGEVHGRITGRVLELVEMLSSVDGTKATSNLWGERWSKLCQNAMKNGISAATGLTSKEIDRNEATRRFSILLGGEGVRIGQALGFALERIGKLEPDCLARAAAGDSAAWRELEGQLLESAGSSARGEQQRPSMGQDILKGRRTEIEFINGFIVDKGAEIGIPAPANARLTDLVKAVERGEIAPSPKIIAEIEIPHAVGFDPPAGSR